MVQAVQRQAATSKTPTTKTPARAEEPLKAAGAAHDGILADFNGVKARSGRHRHPVEPGDAPRAGLQSRPDRSPARHRPHLLSASPAWLTSLHALPMHRPDLRGGVHFPAPGGTGAH